MTKTKRTWKPSPNSDEGVSLSGTPEVLSFGNTCVGMMTTQGCYSFPVLYNRCCRIKVEISLRIRQSYSIMFIGMQDMLLQMTWNVSESHSRYGYATVIVLLILTYLLKFVIISCIIY